MLGWLYDPIATVVATANAVPRYSAQRLDDAPTRDRCARMAASTKKVSTPSRVKKIAVWSAAALICNTMSYDWVVAPTTRKVWRTDEAPFSFSGAAHAG